MSGMKEKAVALLVDVVSSRTGDREVLHEAVLDAARATNEAVAAVDPLRITVGDELQGVYATLGDALAASYTLRLRLAPRWDVRFGIGGGEVRTIDEERNLQDGSAWWLAREAIDWVEEEASRKGHASARTAIRDERPVALGQADALARLIDERLGSLRPATVGTMSGLWEGLDNAAIAEREGISESANSQRVITNGLRPLNDAMHAMATLP